MNTNLLHHIALTLIPDVGPKTAKLLVSYCGSAQAVFKAKKRTLAKIPQIGQKVVNNIADHSDAYDKAEREIRFLEKINARAIDFYSDDYPKRLKHFEASPLVLYARGDMDLNASRTVAIIGTRNPSEQGKIQCEKLIEDLKPYDVQIISGLAYGIDTSAHNTAVDCKMPTIGVMGHGLDRIYPAANKKLAARMIENGGLVTEFPTETKPDRENFPMRNRIIAGLSDVVVVVESKKRGGSIITVEFANAYHKDVFAIPGRINDPLSEGCNRLIKQHKAHLLEGADDIGYIMRWDEYDQAKTVQKSLFIEYSPEESMVMDVFKEVEEVTIDELNYKVKSTPSQLAAMLLNLEFKGAIRSLPGKKYILG